MSKLTKTDFLKSCGNPNLAKRVLQAGGLSWDELLEMKSDAYAADSGAVPGMIYYADTVPFAKKNHLLILQAMREFENEVGPLEVPSPTDEDEYFNFLAWFAWENTMNDFLNYIGE